jgi:hypothetical protein
MPGERPRLARDTEHQRHHAGWVNAHEEWERDKEDARRRAFQQAYDGRGAGGAIRRRHDRRQAAAAAAVADLQARNAEPQFVGQKQPHRALTRHCRHSCMCIIADLIMITIVSTSVRPLAVIAIAPALSASSAASR